MLCTHKTTFSASLDYFVTSSPPYLHQFSTISGGNCITNIPLSPEVQSCLPLCSDLERDGYDSDASVNPYAEVADEGPLKVDEPPLQEVGNGDTPLGVVKENTESSRFIDIPPAKLAQMKVSELKYELSRR